MGMLCKAILGGLSFLHLFMAHLPHAMTNLPDHYHEYQNDVPFLVLQWDSVDLATKYVEDLVEELDDFVVVRGGAKGQPLRVITYPCHRFSSIHEETVPWTSV